MSSCQADLPLTQFHVKAQDQRGDMLIDETITSLENGFIELWLPRNQIINLIIQYSDKIATGKIETFKDSKTCVTTFQLQ